MVQTTTVMKTIVYSFLFFAIGLGSLTAGDSTAIPKPHDAERYQESWQVNPFASKIDCSPSAPPSWSQNWSLSGMFNNNGSIRVTIKNNLTGQVRYVSSESNTGDEFKLIKADFNRNREKASVVITRRNEEAELKYQP